MVNRKLRFPIIQLRHSDPKSETGSVMMQGAVTIGFFLIFIISGIDLMRIAYTSFAGDHALQRTARWALLNGTVGGLSREDSIKQMLEEHGRKYGVPIDRSSVKICPISNTECSADTAGGPGQFFYITYSHPVRFVLLGIATRINFEVIAQNEPAGGASQ